MMTFTLWKTLSKEVRKFGAQLSFLALQKTPGVQKTFCEHAKKDEERKVFNFLTNILLFFYYKDFSHGARVQKTSKMWPCRCYRSCLRGFLEACLSFFLEVFFCKTSLRGRFWLYLAFFASIPKVVFPIYLTMACLFSPSLFCAENRPSLTCAGEGATKSDKSDFRP